MEKYRDKKGNIIKWGEINFNYFPHNTFDKIPILNLLFNKKKKLEVIEILLKYQEDQIMEKLEIFMERNHQDLNLYVI